MSLSKLAIALLKPSLASFCSSSLAVFSAIAALLASISLRLSSTASAASCKPFAKSTMPCLLASISLRLASKASVRPATPLLALSALSATASILEAASTALSAASLALSAASLASFTLLSTLAESSVTLSSAALAAALASAVSCARLFTRVFTAVTSSLTFSMDSESSDEALEISLSTSSNLVEISLPISATDVFRVFTPSVILVIWSMLVLVALFSFSIAFSCSSKAATVSSNRSSTRASTSFTRASTAVRRPAKPTPFRLSASISSLVALRTVLLPLASVVMKSEPEAKPLMVCSNSKVFKSRASLSFLKVSLPVSLSYVVPSPKTVKNAA